MLNLDKISENISTKNFKDDIARTNLAKKVDAVYEGISHRLNYMDRKLETSSGKLQARLVVARFEISLKFRLSGEAGGGADPLGEDGRELHDSERRDRN